MSTLRRYWFPSLDVFRGYRREWIRDDIFAGIALTALLIPAGIGYAEVSASSSRTPVAEQAGSRSQLTGVAGAVMLIGFILLAPDLTSFLPSATLAAVVITAASSPVDIGTVKRLARAHPAEAALFWATNATTSVIPRTVHDSIAT